MKLVAGDHVRREREQKQTADAGSAPLDAVRERLSAFEFDPQPPNQHNRGFDFF